MPTKGFPSSFDRSSHGKQGLSIKSNPFHSSRTDVLTPSIPPLLLFTHLLSCPSPQMFSPSPEPSNGRFFHGWSWSDTRVQDICDTLLAILNSLPSTPNSALPPLSLHSQEYYWFPFVFKNIFSCMNAFYIQPGLFMMRIVRWPLLEQLWSRRFSFSSFAPFSPPWLVRSPCLEVRVMNIRRSFCNRLVIFVIDTLLITI